MIVPVFDPDAHIMPQTGTVGYVKKWRESDGGPT